MTNSDWLDIVVLIWTVPICVGMIALGLRISSILKQLSPLTDAPAPEAWPKLSVIIPACDEVDTLEAALKSVRAQTYPNLEIVLIDDRSTDGTGELMDRLAADDPRITVEHVTVLPDEWLGKVHAMQRGVEAASGEWLLFTDADVHFAPNTLQKAVATAVAGGIDFLALLPKVITRSLALEAFVVAFGAGFFVTARPHKIGQEGSKAFAGVGAFNLIRRATLDASEGLQWLRMEVADDAGLALVAQRAGAKPAFMLANGAVSLEWYPSVPAMIRGLEKNLFGIAAHYRVERALAWSAIVTLIALAPLVAIAWPGPGWLRVLGALALVGIGAVFYAVGRLAQCRLLPSLLAPLVLPLLVWATLRSMTIAMVRGGVRWRGTSYPLATLRALQRVKF